MTRPRLFIEAPAGLAAVSLRLHGGEHCRPPISRMGNKAGYAQSILAALGLRSGEGAGAYLWCEADADVAALLRCYPDAAMLRRVAEIIRGWSSEEPRALWERLRGERKARGARTAEESVAAWFPESDWAYRQGNPDSGFNPSVATGVAYNAGPATWADRCHRLAEYAVIASSNRLINVSADASGDLTNTGQGGTTFGGREFATPPGEVAERFEGMAREVAGTVIEHRWSFSEKGPTFGYGGPGARTKGYDVDESIGCERTSERVAGMVGGWPPVAVLTRIPEPTEVAAMLGTPGDLSGCVMYSDPPYQNTTGYRHDLPRAEVVRLALGYAALGATVCVSEAEALPELVAVGWHVTEITEGRRGQKRTFSAQKREFLTMNREPAHRIATQPSLFGAA